MKSLRPDHATLRHLIRLIDRERDHLLAVRQRLLGDNCQVDAERVTHLLDDDLGIDRLESFAAKFSRMQDTVVDKLIPTVLRASGERTAAAIDNLARMERIGLIDSADEWLEMRGLRNRLVHEYIERPADMAPALERACLFTDGMSADYDRIREHVRTTLGLEI